VEGFHTTRCLPVLLLLQAAKGTSAPVIGIPVQNGVPVNGSPAPLGGPVPGSTMPAEQQYNGAQGQFQGRSVTNGATYYPGAYPGYLGGDMFFRPT
jgi:hypothetical protein